jgi:predicted phage-related endonuclease
VKIRRLGGSDIPKLLGISPYGGPLEVYRRCVLGIEEPAGPGAKRGVLMEPILRAHGQEGLGLKLETRASDYHEHPELDFAWAQIDDVGTLEGRRACIDYKSQSIWAQKSWGPSGSDKMPEHIRAQVAWEMCCADIDFALVVTGFGVDNKETGAFDLDHISLYRLERCPQLESYCVAVARKFWLEHAIPGVPPAKSTGKRKSK